MSAEAFSWAMRQETGSPISKLVLLKLGDHAHPDGGGCFPKVATIAEGTELSERAVRQHLRLLEERGLIVSEARIEEGGQRSNMYRLVMPASPRLIRPVEPTPEGRHVAPPPLKDTPGAPAPGAPGSLRLVQGHIDSNRQKEPSSNVAPKRAYPLSGRALQLAEAIGEGPYRPWFSDAEFIEGNPPKIIMPTLMKRNWVVDHFSTPICKIFGGEVIIEVRQPVQGESLSQAYSPRRIAPGDG